MACRRRKQETRRRRSGEPTAKEGGNAEADEKYRPSTMNAGFLQPF
jgi:hypothetical protein